ncbi:MAG: efflux RND transporter periplasmic adaptor subunit, partial [Gemmataceae bacterium]|nr:efflux RND transporter periplasmic adaptor subunit [Gemmataceae bacterium]
MGTLLAGWLWVLWKAKGKILAYALGAVAVAFAAKAYLLDPREVAVAPVERREVAAEVQGTGTVATKVLAKAGSKINGRVGKVLVEEGDAVTAGQAVALLEDDDLRHQVDRARARLAAAQATASQAASAHERARRLLPGSSISREEYEVFEEKARVARSAVAVEEADLRYRQYKLSEAKVLTLVGGLVTRRWVEPGDAVVAGQPLVSVADTGVTWVDANVDQRFAGVVRKGQPATVILRGRAGYPFRGSVARVYPQADAATEEMLVQVAFPLPPADLQLGQWAEVFIEVGTARDALAVPKEAVMPSGQGRFVFVAGEDGLARRVRVEPGAASPRFPFVAVAG